MLPIGETWYRKEYARTLELIADGGADVCYEGDMAKAIVGAVQAKGGYMTLEDLSGMSLYVLGGSGRQSMGTFQVTDPDGQYHSVWHIRTSNCGHAQLQHQEQSGCPRWVL